MSKIKLLIITFVMILTFAFLQTADAKVSVGNVETNSVYTLSDTLYDEETGKLSYQKITYSQNTYTTMNSTEIDAAGGSVDVSNDAQYVFFPARYLDFTSSTKVSFKFKNNGVQKIVMHAAYSAGVSEGGVDYQAGYKLVCMNALSDAVSWNVSFGKSVDGCDVFTVQFGGYAEEIFDISFIGFRLYFDYGLTVTETREFEVLGYEIHESDVIPAFASDPKPIRVGKLRSNDVTIEDNTFTVNGTANVEASILDSKAGYENLAVTFRVKNDAKIAFKLDGKTVLEDTYEKGRYTVNLSLNGEAYSLLQMSFEAVDTVVIFQSFEFKGQPYLDTFSGSGYTVTTNGDATVVKYTYTVGWYKISAPIREYNTDYCQLHLEFELAQPTLLGIMIDDTYLVNHWSKVIYEAGKHELVFDVSNITISDSSALILYLDPEVSGYNGTSGEKTVTFTKVAFSKLPELPQADITVASSFEFDYDGKEKVASGATSNSGTEIYYEYKLEGLSDKYYDTVAPVNAGVYDVRIVSPRTEEYNLTYAYSKLTINKVKANKPNSSIFNIDYLNSKLYFDDSFYTVSIDEAFTKLLSNGSYVVPGMTLYYKVTESDNNAESDVAITTLAKNTESVDVAINYTRERTVSVVPNTVEYSTDGINWTSATGARVGLKAGTIYLFRVKATETKFAGEITYLAVPQRQANTAKIELVSTTKTAVTVKMIDGAEYRIIDSNGDVIYDWEEYNEFTDLDYGSTVTVCMRMKGTSTSYASEEVAIRLVLGQKDSVENVEVGSTEVNIPTETVTPEISFNDENNVEISEGNRIVVSNYNELTAAIKTTNNVTMTTIVINGTVYLEYDITVKGKVTFVGGENGVLAFENNGKKRTIYNSKGCELHFENITLKRTVTDETEGYLFRFESSTVSFTEVTFDVATLATVNEQYDRITYCPSGTELTIYFNNCTYETEAYFYRGTMVFYNCDLIPKTAGKPTIYDFSGLKLNYEEKTFKFPSTIKVSEEDDFSELVGNGSTIKSNTTYYATKDGFVFEFKTRNLKLAKPTIDNLFIDFVSEKVYFSDKHMVALDDSFTQLVTSGDQVAPGMTLYVKRLAEGIYFESDAAEIKVPERPTVFELESAFICEFGFVMSYYENVEYSIGGEYQLSPVFVGLESNTTYTVTMRFKATDSSFASSEYTVTITTK